MSCRINKLSVLILLLSAVSFAWAQHKTFYDLSARTIAGEQFDFSILKGKKVLIVNTATGCSLAPQLKKLQELYLEYGGNNFEIIAFPSNDFGQRESGSNEQIRELYRNKYNVTFTLMEKISIRGEAMHPVYRWLTSQKENGVRDANVIWNFQKFLVDENGQVVESLLPVASPESPKILEWLKN